MNQTSTNRRHAGFTLLELLVVLAILGMLGALVGPRVLGQLDNSKPKTTQLQVKNLESAADMYKLDVGRYPTTQEGLEALVTRPGTVTGWNGPYLRGEVPKDAWGNTFHYESPGKRGDVDIYSLGADNAAGGEGNNADIGNWQ